MKNKLARVVSRVFDPIVIVPIMLVMAAWGAFVNGARWRYLTLLVFLDALLPGFVLVYFIMKGKVLSGWDVKKREERLPLFVFVAMTHLVGVFGAWLLNKHLLAEYLTSFWLLTVIYAVITVKWKISLHSGVVSALVTFVVLTEGAGWWLYGLVGLVVWARVETGNHGWLQALAGALVPGVMLPVSFWGFGLV